MFVRVKSSPNSPKKSVQIVESHRDGDKVRQRIVRHVGTALDEDELERLKDLAEYIKAKLESESKPSLYTPEEMARVAISGRLERQKRKETLKVDLKKLREVQRVSVGVPEVYGPLYRELGFDKALVNAWRKRSASEHLFHLVMARIANPESKRATVESLASEFGIQLSLPAVYRSMDAVCDRSIERIQKLAFEAATTLLGRPVNVVFYDCTTLFFESVTSDELRAHGFSKDGKPHQIQVLLALLVTPEGLPIGYDVFPGNRFEGHTLQDAIGKLKKQFRIDRIIFVADCALLSKPNLDALDEAGAEYIVAARLKNLKREEQNAVLKLDAYTKTRSGAPFQKMRTLPLDGARRLVVTYSEKRAEKDRFDREKQINQSMKRLSRSANPSTLLSGKGNKRFIKLSGESRLELDEAKIEEAAKWDGLHGVVTNVRDLSPAEIVAQYHQLWQIEACFRLTKHDLRIRPVFHWTPRRIKAHIALCFMALVCVRHLQHRFQIQYEPFSAERIRRALNAVQVSVLEHTETRERYGVPSSITIDARRLYQAAGLKLSNVPFKIS